MNHVAEERAFEIFHFALEPGGYLFIGSSESVDGSSDLFAPVDKGNHIYQSRQATSGPIPLPESARVYSALEKTDQEATRTERANLERISHNDLHLKLLEQFVPPSIVVNEEYDIVHLSEKAGKYLNVAGGEPTNNLLRLIRSELGWRLGESLFQAVRQKSDVEARGLKVKLGNETETINLQIRPVISETDTARGYILIVFEPSTDGNLTTRPAEEYKSTEPVVLQLEEELIRSRGQLQSALEQAEVQSEELRASNEELQAMNEELRSSTKSSKPARKSYSRSTRS